MRSIDRIPATRFSGAGVLAALALFTLLEGCSGGDLLTPPPVQVPAGSQIVSGPRSPTLTPGLTQQMLAIVTDASGAPMDVTVRWTSSDPSVATIAAGGLVIANRVGSTVLTAAYGTLSSSALLTVQSAPVTSAELLEHHGVVTTVFWVGEGADASNSFISNAASAFDRLWLAHYGGVDSPSPRRGFLPAGFTPLENPFYFALPYSDFDDGGSRKENAGLVIPWSASRAYGASESMVKNRWMRITSPQTLKSCYAQWEDAGPGVYDDFQYVFGSSPPGNPFVLDGLSTSSALDVSPAVRDCLGLADDVMSLTWQFVADADVPAGPWTVTITRSGRTP